MGRSVGVCLGSDFTAGFGAGNATGHMTVDHGHQCTKHFSLANVSEVRQFQQGLSHSLGQALINVHQSAPGCRNPECTAGCNFLLIAPTAEHILMGQKHS
jgi:hypothetical protein